MTTLQHHATELTDEQRALLRSCCDVVWTTTSPTTGKSRKAIVPDALVMDGAPHAVARSLWRLGYLRVLEGHWARPDCYQLTAAGRALVSLLLLTEDHR